MDISTNEKTQFWQTDQSQNFVVHVSYLTKQTLEFCLVTAWGYIRGRITPWSIRDKDKTISMVKILATGKIRLNPYATHGAP